MNVCLPNAGRNFVLKGYSAGGAGLGVGVMGPHYVSIALGEVGWDGNGEAGEEEYVGGFEGLHKCVCMYVCMGS